MSSFSNQTPGESSTGAGGAWTGGGRTGGSAAGVGFAVRNGGRGSERASEVA